MPFVQPTLSSQHRRRLLELARSTAQRSLARCPPSTTVTQPTPETPIEGSFGGAFVTFWNSQRLRGCLGSFVRTDDIQRTIVEVTQSSLADPRFLGEPITLAELDRLTIEISILSDLEATDDPTTLILGKHGIVVRRQSQTGCFLPKVATQNGWDVPEFLSRCCSGKAGLKPDAWRDPETHVFLFTAEVFSDASCPTETDKTGGMWGRPSSG